MSAYVSPEQQSALKQIDGRNVETVHLQFTDLLGVKSVSIPVTRLEKAVTEGIYFGGSSIEGFVRIQESDTRLTPDPSTFTVLPWIHDGATVGRMICDVVELSKTSNRRCDGFTVLRVAIRRGDRYGATGSTRATEGSERGASRARVRASAATREHGRDGI